MIGYAANQIRYFAEERLAQASATRAQLDAQRDAREVFLDHCAALARSSCVILGVPRIKRAKP